MKNALFTTLASIALVASLSGCVSWYKDAPTFEPAAAPADYGVIYVLRPTSQFGMLQTITAGVDKGHWFDLYPGSYGAFYAKPGKVKLKLAIDAWASVGMFTGGIGGAGFTIITAGAEADSQAAIVEVDVPAGGAVYVRTAVDGWKEPPEIEVLSAADGASDISDLHLAAGGRPHAPAASPVASPATPAPVTRPTEPVAPARPTLDPALDHVFLKNGQILSGTLVSEDAKAVTILLKEGFGKAVPASDVERIQRHQ